MTEKITRTILFFTNAKHIFARCSIHLTLQAHVTLKGILRPLSATWTAGVMMIEDFVVSSFHCSDWTDPSGSVSL